jgi:hydroxymethylglutaryl-CoA lyase
LANALMGLQLGVEHFDSACAAGSVAAPLRATRVRRASFARKAMGIATGVDLDALTECARMAETIVGHPLPGKLMRGGTLRLWRQPTA